MKADQLVKKWLESESPESEHDDGCEGFFDPWDDLGLLGSYSSAFDDLAIAVLADMRDEAFTDRGLAGEIFRELLCMKGLCEYGTSPRCCWPIGAFLEALPAILAKWVTLRAIRWG